MGVIINPISGMPSKLQHFLSGEYKIVLHDWRVANLNLVAEATRKRLHRHGSLWYLSGVCDQQGLYPPLYLKQGFSRGLPTY